MGFACYVAVEGKPDAATMMDGKALAAALERLDLVAREGGLRSLHEFLAAGPNDPMIALARESGVQLPDGALSRWFDPAEGIDAIQALVAAFPADGLGCWGSNAPADADVLRDLDAAIAVLSEARALGRRWYLAMEL